MPRDPSELSPLPGTPTGTEPGPLGALGQEVAARLVRPRITCPSRQVGLSLYQVKAQFSLPPPPGSPPARLAERAPGEHCATYGSVCSHTLGTAWDQGLGLACPQSHRFFPSSLPARPIHQIWPHSRSRKIRAIQVSGWCRGRRAGPGLLGDSGPGTARPPLSAWNGARLLVTAESTSPVPS